MEESLILQFFTLSLYSLFMGFCFCDGFGLSTFKKLIWFIAFFFISIFVLRTKGQFELSLILPIPLILALFLCAYEKRKKEKA